MAQSQEGIMSGESDFSRYRQNPTMDTIVQLLSEGVGSDTKLSKAVDNLYVAWNQLLCNLLAKPGFQAPGPEHIKEVAEFTLKQLKDASQDLSREFVQAGLEWRLSHPDEARAEDLRNREDSIQRQSALIERVSEVVRQRLQMTETAMTTEPQQ